MQYLFSGLPGYLPQGSKIKIKQCKIAAGLTPSHSGYDEYQSINASACPSEGQFCIMCFVVPKKFTAGRSLSHLKCSPSTTVFFYCWLLFLHCQTLTLTPACLGVPSLQTTWSLPYGPNFGPVSYKDGATSIPRSLNCPQSYINHLFLLQLVLGRQLT